MASWSSVSNVYITKFYFMPEESGIYVFSFSSTNYEPELLVGSFGFDCCSKNDGQGLGNSYSSADSKEFYLKAGVYYPMKVLGTGGRPSLAASKDGVAILISSFQWYTDDDMDTAECSVVSALPVPVPVPSTTSTISTSASATPTGLLSQEMTGCEISNAASLGFTKGTNMISLSNVYTTKFYFKPEVSGTYVFIFSSTNYEPKLLVGSFGFDCCSKNDGQGLGNSYSSADSKEFYLEAGVYYPMKVLGTGGRPSLAASKSGVAILISDFQWYTPDNLDTAECSVVSALPKMETIF
ncbi:hypothetical protein B5S27_g4708 [[Candida] boidinii]|nr:hypothetical protein B5S27_g4708 [[Candida] boidinii]